MSPEKTTFMAAVEEALRQEGALNLNFTGNDDEARWDFLLQRDGQSWPLYLRAPYWSLAPLPYLHWAVPEPVWGWPHTGEDGSICAFDRQGLDYDAMNHREVIRCIIDKSMQMLLQHHSMSEAERLAAFADELDAYARKVGITALALDQPLGSSKRVHASVRPKEKGLPEIVRINSQEPLGKELQRQSFLVLDVDIAALPPLVNGLDNDWWTRLCVGLPDKMRQRLTEDRGCGAILRIPNRFGSAQFLLYWGNRDRTKERQLYRLEPAHHDYLTRRVGQRSMKRHIAVIGVGAVGSRVAEHLALSGIEHLTLVDPDAMSANNLGRHVLSRDFLGLNKAICMALHLRKRMPGIEVAHYPTTMQEWLMNTSPSDFDVIVLATGDPASERLLLRRAWKEGWQCRLVSTFVEAANLGGHAISMQPGEPGCVECLYEAEDPDTLGQLRTGMLAPGQFPTQEISGCGAFTPYSAITATRTALLAAELALPDSEIGYHRWAGSDASAVALNLHPSNFWNALRTGRVQPFLPRQSYIREGCPCCTS